MRSKTIGLAIGLLLSVNENRTDYNVIADIPGSDLAKQFFRIL